MFRISLFSALAGVLLAGVVQADVPRVATDIAPVHGLVARVMQGLGSPDLVVQPGASPHGYSMRPSEARALDRADFVFWIGEALTPWLEGSITNLAADARVVELLAVEGVTLLPLRQGARFIDHADEGHEDHTDEDHADEGHEGHDHHGIGAHAWLAPDNGKLWLGLIADELAQFDPDNADTYRANAVAGQAEIDTVVARINNKLAPFRRGRFVVFHDAYQYFEKGFGLSALAAISLSDASSPSPARIAEVRSTVANLAVTCVFSEPQFNPGLVSTVLGAGKVKTAVLDPMGTALPLGPQFYPALLLDLGQRMADCH